MTITQTMCVFVVLGIRHAVDMGHIVILFSLSHKRQDFREKKVLGHKICVSSFFTTFVLNIFHSKKK